MTNTPDILLGSIKAIIAEELPEPYAANADLVFGNLCEGQAYRTRSQSPFWGQVNR